MLLKGLFLQCMWLEYCNGGGEGEGGGGERIGEGGGRGGGDKGQCYRDTVTGQHSPAQCSDYDNIMDDIVIKGSFQ